MCDKKQTFTSEVFNIPNTEIKVKMCVVLFLWYLLQQIYNIGLSDRLKKVIRWYFVLV